MNNAMQVYKDNLLTIEAWSSILHIDSDKKLEDALQVMEDIMNRMGAGENHLRDSAEVLSSAIEHYEQERFPIEKPSGIDMLTFFMDQHGHKQTDLSDVASRSVICELLSGKRQLNKNHIEKLAKKYHVSPAVFF
jgi:HTH-type transcriptional regulator / antitoxin HigA